MIHVIATIQTAEGKRDEFLGHFRQLIFKVRLESGCIEYVAAVDLEPGLAVQDPTRSSVVVVIEKWETVEALEAHLVAPHVQEYRGAVEDLVVDTKIQVLRPAE